MKVRCLTKKEFQKYRKEIPESADACVIETYTDPAVNRLLEEDFCKLMKKQFNGLVKFAMFLGVGQEDLDKLCNQIFRGKEVQFAEKSSLFDDKGIPRLKEICAHFKCERMFAYILPDTATIILMEVQQKQEQQIDYYVLK